MLCPASDVLPQVREAEPDRATSRGLVIHEYLAAVPSIGWKAALAQVPEEWREHCAAIELSRLPACQPESFAAEVSIAYHLATGAARVLGHNIPYEEAKAKLMPGEMLVRIDSLGLTVDSVLIFDYKSGRRWTGPVRSIRQLRAYGLVAARAYGKSQAIVGIIRIGEDGRPWFDGGNEEDGLLDALELGVVEEEIRAMVAARDEARRHFNAGGRPRLVPGDHCTYCPALTGCPAHIVGLRALAAGHASTFLAGKDAAALDEAWRRATDEALAVATEAELAGAVDALKVAKKRLEYLERSLKHRAELQPIQGADGRLWGPKLQDKVADLNVAKDTLAILYGDVVADTAVIPGEPSMSKESIRNALREHVLPVGGKISKLEAECVQALREAGAIHREPKFTWYTPKDEDEPVRGGGGASP